MTIKITKAMAVKATRQAVQERGRGYRDQNATRGDGCEYAVYDGDHNPTGPSCVAGTALFNLGAAPAVLARLDSCGTIDDPDSLEALEEEGITLTPTAVHFLRQAQIQQDAGHTWGESLRWALDNHEDVY